LSIDGPVEAPLRATTDAWLGERLGMPSWRVVAGATGEPLASLRDRGKLFAYAKVPVTALDRVRELVAAGFYPVDVAVTFEGPVPQGTEVSGRFARPEDREAVARIAGECFEFSRFHLDPQIPRPLADRMKADWAANFFAGQRGDAMAVAEAEGRVVAFLQLFHQPRETLLIDLVGVASGFQGRGIARRLIQFACSKPAGAALPRRLRVGTQVANTRSVRLYESLGLRLAEAQYVLHFHGA
jgi:ribosomal protein S18 acetylase RimI-like enzyme